jgi:NitT/TauT family transport system permease protein
MSDVGYTIQNTKRLKEPCETLADRSISVGSRFFRKTVVIALLLVVWQVLPTYGFIDPMFLPPFSEVAGALVHTIISGELLTNFLASFLRAVAGFGLALLIGIPLGLLMGWFKVFENYVDPILQLSRNVSALAIYPVFILFLGLGEESKVAVIFMGALWPILLNTIAGVNNLDPILIKAARSLALSDLEIFRKVVLPSTVPSIAAGIRLSASISLIVLVAAEMIGAKSGLGFMIINAQYNFMIPEMYAAIVTLAVVGLVVNCLLVWMEKRATSWKEEICK